VCAFVPVIFLLDSCMFYVRMFYGPSWSDLNKYTLSPPLVMSVYVTQAYFTFCGRAHTMASNRRREKRV